MYIVFTTSLIALILTYFNSKNKIRNGMFWGFVMITTLGVIHYDYGNDYMTYYQMFTDFNKYEFNIGRILEGTYHRDSGWVILCHLFNKIGGFFMMVAVLNIIQNILVYSFIKNFVAKEWWTLAIFIYLFLPNLYLLNFSMMRQGLIVCLFLGMWQYIKERKWWYPLIVFYLCSYIHTSSIILLPFAFWGYIPFIKSKQYIYIYIATYFILWINIDVLNYLFTSIVSTDGSLENYVNTYGGNISSATYSIGFIVGLLPLVLSLHYIYSNNNKDNNRIVLLYLMSFLIVPFTFIIPDITRISIYFSVYAIAVLPIIYNNIKNRKIRLIFILLFIIKTMYDYWIFFNVGVFAKPYSTFHTIFELL